MSTETEKRPPHAWKGVWERPVHIDENSHDKLTIARMTDHNVRGSDREGDFDRMSEEQRASELGRPPLVKSSDPAEGAEVGEDGVKSPGGTGKAAA